MSLLQVGITLASSKTTAAHNDTAVTSEAKRKPIGSGYPVKPLGTSAAGMKARGSSLVDLVSAILECKVLPSPLVRLL